MGISARIFHTIAWVMGFLLPWGGLSSAFAQTSQDQMPEQAPARLDSAAFLPGAFPATQLTGKETRLGGTNRFATAAALSARITGQTHHSDTVFIASGADFADGLSIGALAAYTGSALLLTTPGQIPAETLAEITTLAPSKIVIAGGTSSVSQAVQDQLAALLPMGGNLVRLAGETRYATSQAIAAQFPQGVPAIVTSGASFADAVVAGAAAAKVGGPVVLTERNAQNAESLAALATLLPSSITMVGGTWDGQSLATFAQAAGTKTPTVLAGTDRYQTSAKVATAFWGATPARIAYANGANFPDALAGVGAAKAFDLPIVLTRSYCLPDSAVNLASQQANYILLGGPNMVSAQSAALPCSKAVVSENDGVYSFNMTWVQQFNGYYCGPAVGYMLLSKLGKTISADGKPLSQNVLATTQYFRTEADEATLGETNQLTKGLNAWLGNSTYRRVIDPTSAEFKRIVLASLTTTKRPVAVLTQENQNQLPTTFTQIG